MGFFPTRITIGTTLLAGALAGVTGTALADVKRGVDAWSTGDYTAAVREWKGAADAGDPDAQFNLAQAYKLGRGVPRDLSKAEALYGLAAAKGHLQAADNYGLLLFQRGERARAMPYVRAAAGRGDPRAQYVLGLALFNGDTAPKDWIRAYAYVNLAQQQGLPQAAGALAQMDQHIPLADRQKAVALAARIDAESNATRARQLAAVDLGSTAPPEDVAGPAPALATPSPRRDPTIASVERAVSEATRAAGAASPATAGADYTVAPPPPPRGSPSTANTGPKPTPTPSPAPSKPALPAVRTTAAATPVKAPTGPWRVQLGAFGVPGNADALWQRVKGRPELAGHGKLLVPAGRVTKLQAGGFATQGEASTACARLKAAGFGCLVARD